MYKFITYTQEVLLGVLEQKYTSYLNNTKLFFS